MKNRKGLSYNSASTEYTIINPKGKEATCISLAMPGLPFSKLGKPAEAMMEKGSAKEKRIPSYVYILEHHNVPSFIKMMSSVLVKLNSGIRRGQKADISR